MTAGRAFFYPCFGFFAKLSEQEFSGIGMILSVFRNGSGAIRRRWYGLALVPAALAIVVTMHGVAFGGSTTATTNATISESGSVGETTTTTTTQTTTGQTPNTSTVNGGGSASQAASVEQPGVTTFRPLPSSGPAPAADGAEGDAAAEDGGETETEDTDTDTAGGGDQGAGGTATADGPRLPSGAQPIGNLIGGLSSVAVTGTPNQTFGISLPGNTVIVQGNQTVKIEGFVHNAGDTPTMGANGRSSFNVGAKVSADGAGSDGAAPASPASNPDAPVITSQPFMDVIILYN